MIDTALRSRGKALGAFGLIVLAGCGGIPQAPAVQPLTEGVLVSLPTITFEAPSGALPVLTK
jgi:hypothetical protein